MALDSDAYGGGWTFSNSPGWDSPRDQPATFIDPNNTWDMNYLNNDSNQAALRGMGYTGSFSEPDDSAVSQGFKDWAGANNIVAGRAGARDTNQHQFLSGLFNSQTGKSIGEPYGYRDGMTFAQLMAPALMFAGPALGAAFGGGIAGGATAGAGIGGVMGGVGGLEQGTNPFTGALTGVVKGGAQGTLGSLFGSGMDQYNLGGELGLKTGAGGWGSFINKAGNTLGSSLVTGKNPTGSLLSNAANTATSSLGDYFNSSPTTTGSNLMDFNTGYDFGSNPMDMQGFPSLTTPGTDYNPSFGGQFDTAQSPGTDWQDHFKKFGNNPIIKGLLGMGGDSQPTQPGQPVQNGGGFGSSVLGGLAGLYLGNKQGNAINGQIGGLNSLFGQNSPYAQQLRQQLDRKDAAAGRRSQSGTREVELQARLAELNSRNAPQLQSLYNQQNGNRNLMINTLMNNKGLQGLFKQGIAGLNSYLQPDPYTQALQGSSNMWTNPQDNGYYDSNSELFGGTGG